MGTADVAADRIADEQVDTWRVATWAVPITAEIVIAVMIGVLWLLATTSAFADLELGWLLTGAAITAGAAIAAAGYLTRAPSSWRRGLGLSVAASAGIVAVGATAIGVVFHR
ncbi:hypothetical protein H7J07_07530 [Mycobacterium koreense]|uniref:Uncharacterized protein n=1 Tax=Mycolicibacillus koreensis TaxID=1069220 RepID=A0A7I7SG80_9MYCO|nr:hypothetical protein [Mycolicibacillus koreensis]MCV7248070.1 hypothetical protein [Mycolicibacillus koreensis]OSC35806.1 hypothetical protein B8W67_01710 [Mycolicibacillus koreensis]BBY55005.1 hypothetical protein MKOR_22560 [Mycolicibacillus koreensis]